MYRAYVEQTQSEKIYDIFRCLEVILTKLTTLPFF